MPQEIYSYAAIPPALLENADIVLRKEETVFEVYTPARVITLLNLYPGLREFFKR